MGNGLLTYLSWAISGRRAAEGRQARLEVAAALVLWVHLFLLIVGLAVARSAGAALFLHYYHARGLASVYIVVGLAVAVVLYGVSRLSVGVSADRAALVTMGLVGVGAAGFRLLGPGADAGAHRLFYGLLYVAIESCALTATLQFWTLASSVFSLSQAQRLYVFIASGGIFGSIAGGLVTRWVASYSILGLLWVAAGLSVPIMGAILVYARVARGLGRLGVKGELLELGGESASDTATRTCLPRLAPVKACHTTREWHTADGAARRQRVDSGSSDEASLSPHGSWRGRAREKGLGVGARLVRHPIVGERGLVGLAAKLGGVAFMTVFTTTLVDFYFKFFADQQYGGELRDLAGFFGNFYLAVGLVTLAVQLCVTPLVVRKATPFAGLISMPGLLGVAAAVNFVSPALWPATVLKLIDSALAHSLDRSCREMLYTPLPARWTGPLKALADGMAGRMGLLAAGLFLWVSAPLVHPRQMLVAIAGCLVVWFGAVMVLRRAYRVRLPGMWERAREGYASSGASRANVRAAEVGAQGHALRGLRACHPTLAADVGEE